MFFAPQVLRAMEYGGVYVASAELDTPGLVEICSW